MRARPAVSGPELEGSMIHRTSRESEGSSADPGGRLCPPSLLPLFRLFPSSENIITVFVGIFHKKSMPLYAMFRK